MLNKHSIQNIVIFYLIQDSRINRLLKYTLRTVVTQLLYWRGYFIVTNTLATPFGFISINRSYSCRATFFFKSNGRYIDYLSFTCATSKGKNIKSYVINTTFKKRENIKNINTLKPFKISTKISLFHRAFRFTKFYLYQRMHLFF